MISRSKSNTAFMLHPHQTKHLRGFICRLHLFTATRLQAAERSLLQETCYKCQIVPPLRYLGCGADTPPEVSSRWWSRPSPPTPLHLIKFIWAHTGWSACSLPVTSCTCFSFALSYIIEVDVCRSQQIPWEFVEDDPWACRGKSSMGKQMVFHSSLIADGAEEAEALLLSPSFSPFISFHTPRSIFISRVVSCIGPASYDFLCPFPTIHLHIRGEHLSLAEQWAHCSRPSHIVHNQRHVSDRSSGARDQQPIN